MAAAKRGLGMGKPRLIVVLTQGGARSPRDIIQ
jgi:hypothetical protein